MQDPDPDPKVTTLINIVNKFKIKFLLLNSVMFFLTAPRKTYFSIMLNLKA